VQHNNPLSSLLFEYIRCTDPAMGKRRASAVSRIWDPTKELMNKLQHIRGWAWCLAACLHMIRLCHKPPIMRWGNCASCWNEVKSFCIERILEQVEYFIRSQFQVSLQPSWSPFIFFSFSVVEELHVTRYRSGSFPVNDVGNSFSVFVKEKMNNFGT
jgi:hypothetical protein